MTTWISKSGICAAAMATLAGCDEGAGFSLSAPTAVPLRQAEMLQGQVTLVPPGGYCIDPRSLKQRFALMARCDALTTDAGTGGAPVGIITVSLAPLAPGSALPSARNIADAARLKNIRNVSRSNTRVTLRGDGATPGASYAATQWRGAATIGGASIGIAVYGPKDGRAITTEGRDMINDLITRTRRKTG